ncbi:polysaccharide export protein [Vibrio viridaestus]|uniref:Polysaccharide export protein n=2 Tax=Vibrio viridaestus TaxID=2487322 RepID=A0A3N9TKQ0_9VIBR|nr:polysaccharide export protein [Vibrio viridaestus]
MYNMLTRALVPLFMGCFLWLISLNSWAGEYNLAAGDTIKISVYGEEDLTFDEYLIDGSETIDYPYLGNISLHGKTIQKLQNYITSGLKGTYLVDPKVTVSIVKYRNIYVNGVVNRPGGYEYQPGLTVQKAIALAGGFLARYRKTRGIYLTKDSEIEGLSQQQIEAFLKDRPQVDLNDPVGPGDIIYVVSSFW